MNVAIKHFWLSGTWVRPPVAQTVNVSDLIVSADSVRTTVAFIRSLTDSSKSVDRVGIATAFRRSLTDTLKPTDRVVNIASFIRALTDSSKIADRFERTVAVRRSLTDLLKAADRSESVVAFIRALFDASRATDLLDKTAHYIRSITEITHALDSVARVASYVRVSTDIGRAADILTKELSLTISDTYKAADEVNRIIVKTLEDSAKAADLLEKTSTLLRELVEILKALDRIETAVAVKPRPGIPYTQRYGLTFEQWVERRAGRIRRALEMFYTSNVPVDVQVLAERVYRERLGRVSKLSWMPVKGVLTDFRPSPFIKNFLAFLVDRLIRDGYVDPQTMRVVRVPSVDYLKGLVGS